MTNSFDLALPINDGSLGNNGSEYMMVKQQQQQQQSRIISAASSVVSANSLSSSSTKASSMGAAGGGANIATQANVNWLKKSLEEKKESDLSDDSDNSNGLAKTLSPRSNSTASSSRSSPVTTATGNKSTAAATNPMVMQMGAPPHPVAEFLFQLTKMLTDNNSEYIEWRNASIFVHNPPGLEKDILPKYFRHSNYSSFQRQMNYFGFRKIAGKGKMAPCSYVNENAKEDISSLLFIKRKKTGVSSAAAKLMAQQNRINRTIGGPMANSMMGANTLMNMGAGFPSANAAALGGGMSNFGMMGGVQGMGGAGTAGGGNMLVNDQASSLLREQQNMLAQLQQAHASALTSNHAAMNGMGGSAVGNCHQAAAGVQKYPSSSNGSNSTNTGLLTNDQGNVYPNSNNPTDWTNQSAVDAALQGFGAGNFPQGMGAGASSAGSSDPNGFPRIDSAASLRALINQQISMFNAPVDMNSLAAGAPSSMPQAPGPVPCQQGQPGLANAGNVSQGLSYEWNEMLQRMGGGGAVTAASMDNVNSAAANASASLRQLEQQLMQGQMQGGSSGAAPGPAPSSQSYNFSGFFGQGGHNGPPQGYSS